MGGITSSEPLTTPNTSKDVVETFMFPLMFENKRGCNKPKCTGKIEQEWAKKLTGYYEIVRFGTGIVSQRSIPRFDIQPTDRHVCNMCKHVYTSTELEKLPVLPMTPIEQEAFDALKRFNAKLLKQHH